MSNTDLDLTKRCISPLASRPILYTDTIKGGQQALRDDLWAVTSAELNEIELARRASPQPVAVDEQAKPTDEQYQEILRPVLSRYGMHRYLNGDEITLNPSDYRAIIDRAIEFGCTQHSSAAPSAQIADDHAGDDATVINYGTLIGMKFPELPEPAHEIQDQAKADAFTAEQMFEYGRKCVESATQPPSVPVQEQIADDHAGDELRKTLIELTSVQRELIDAKAEIAAFLVGAHPALSTQPPSVPVQEQSDKGASIKTWQERMPEHVHQIGTASSEAGYKDAEIAELRAALAQQSCPPVQAGAPVDPLEWPIPCDLVDGSVTMRKGVKLRTVLARLKYLSGLCRANLHKAY